jgi:GTP-sensing pleiotropic transcriptional regulator CodY
VNPAKRAALARFINRDTVRTLVADSVDDLTHHIYQLLAQNPLASPSHIGKMKAVVPGLIEDNLDSLVDLIVENHDQIYTDDEVVALAEFYTTEVGSRVLAKQAALLNLSSRAGAIWGEQVLQPAINHLLSKTLSS